MDRVRIGLIGSGFITSLHAEAFQHCAAAELVAVASPTAGRAETFAGRFRIPRHFTDWRKLVELKDVDVVVIGAPNDLHCAMTVAAAASGKHVICEKPLCLNLAEADQMIAACKNAGVKLMYAEELCFAPKYVRLKQLLDEGALGKPVFLKQSEKHDGPHAPHFWDVQRSGGGVTMDMGCHAIQFFRWMLTPPSPPYGERAGVRGSPSADASPLTPDPSPHKGERGANAPAIASVYAHMGTHVHTDKTQGDDHALIILDFANGVAALAEESWTKLGGMDDRAEVHGSHGVAYADLLHGNAIETYSTAGYGYAVEKAGSTKGWSFTIYEEAWNYGFPQEMAHFVDCVQRDREPLVTGEDGRAVLEAIFAAYESARTGRKVPLPFATTAAKPHDLWKP
jgi:predicted dehydrogenase